MSNNELLKNTLFENVNLSNEIFTKHFHDTYTVGITHAGMVKFLQNNNAYDAYKLTTRINNPGDLHSGASTSWKHSNFYPSIELMSNMYQQIFHIKKAPIFEKHIIEDELLYSKLHKLFYSIFSKSDKMLIETNLIDSLSYLILNYTNKTKDVKDFYNNKIVIKESLEFINDSIKEPLNLTDLSSNVNLSKYHFLRVFKKELGLTPHQYILMKKIEKAKNLILKGESLLDASLEVGFNDQSHFIRNFKRIYDYTPSKLIKNSNIILYK